MSQMKKQAPTYQNDLISCNTYDHLRFKIAKLPYFFFFFLSIGPEINYKQYRRLVLKVFLQHLMINSQSGIQMLIIMVLIT